MPIFLSLGKTLAISAATEPVRLSIPRTRVTNETEFAGSSPSACDGMLPSKDSFGIVVGRAVPSIQSSRPSHPAVWPSGSRIPGATAGPSPATRSPVVEDGISWMRSAIRRETAIVRAIRERIPARRDPVAAKARIRRGRCRLSTCLRRISC